MRNQGFLASLRRFFGELVALPLRPLAFVASRSFSGKGALRHLIWILTGETSDAASWFQALYRSDPADARKRAEAILQRHPDGALVTTIGYIDWTVFGEDARLKAWIAAARAANCARPEEMLYLELMMATTQEDLWRCSEAILSRNDLPPHFSRLALYNRMEFHVTAGELDEAEALVNRVIDMEEDQGARIIQLALAMIRGIDLGPVLRTMPQDGPNPINTRCALAAVLAKQQDNAKGYLEQCTVYYLKNTRFEPRLAPIAQEILEEKYHAESV